MKKTLSLTLAAMLGSSILLSACGGGEAPSNQGSDQEQSGKTYSFKLTHITQPTHVWHKTSEKFNEELQARSNGRMKVDIFPAGQLGAEKDMVQQLESGTLEFGIITNAYMSTRAEAFNAWSMPFLFKNLEETTAATKTEPAQKILDELSKNGIQGLAYLTTGIRQVFMKEGFVDSPEDLKGKKIRVLGSPSILDFWRTVGAGPTPIPLPEIYTSLQSGVIDGIDIDTDALFSEKYYEIAKDLTITNHMAFPGIVVMSKMIHDQMSAEDQKIVAEAMQAAIDWGNQEAIEREHKNLVELKKLGVNVTELTNTESFNAIRDEVYAKYSANTLIKEFIETIRK
ncbi:MULTISPECIES: TRAP transporter substrate-binding protein [unclassified Paenibacillus]|uniref:TRAP transporter substrate-binding protein n=1 Tax=unclassified Paenibacillus TaxID=185978 RepID=UPI001AE5ABAD|nr:MULTISPECIES: TRAP transporter substrate-binding protein [unclassified Paenibacillus]MBP1154945.1 tripartite ATP-independent transporter DctP family solute receptor [Paenibacillus sp. PvP091]MBP1169671.1 tripartite ATP-independent transporter DctP family solute receptor [Paenibacillus sp. PvR098]MBP2440699.1 tripartite ATP-independent transporter DctP family solute receptor [Paenibacillus sp. PvP052]